MKEKIKPTGEKPTDVTPEMIENWKSQGLKITRMKSVDGKYTGYFKNPDREIVSAASSILPDGIASNAVYAEACFMGGDKEIFTIDKYFFSLQTQLEKLVDVVKVESETL